MSRFAGLRGIPDWNRHADTFEVATLRSPRAARHLPALRQTGRQPALPSGAHVRRIG